MYADGIYPEDTLSKNDKRNFWAIYLSFQQGGQEALGTEEPWFTLAFVCLTELENYMEECRTCSTPCSTRTYATLRA